MEKVFCSECRWLEVIEYNPSCTDYMCKNPKMKSLILTQDPDTWLLRGKTKEFFLSPREINKKNDCKFFEKDLAF